MSLASIPVLNSERLTLRGFAADDLESYAQMMAVPDVRAFLSAGSEPLGHYESWREMCAVTGHWNLLGYGVFAVVEKVSGALIGRVGPHHAEGGPGVEIGWMIASSCQGKGYAYEAARLAIDWFFESHPDEQRLISLIDVGNAPSIALAEKLGETNTGETFTHWQDGALDIWELTRERWTGS